MPLPLRQTNDRNFSQDIAVEERPVLVYFHDSKDEACEFTQLLLESYARDAAAGPVILFADREDTRESVDLFSIPDGPVMLMIRNRSVLGYKTGKLNRERLEGWITRTLEKPDADGIALDDLTRTLATKQEKQQQAQTQSIARARRVFMASAAIKVGGGLALATAFPIPGAWLGFAGYAIAGYNAFRGFQTYADSAQKPQMPKSLAGKCANAFMDAATWVGGFALLGVAFNVASGLSFAATLGAGSFMLFNGSIGLGRLLPGGLLMGSLKKNANEIAQRDPTKPLDEYSPPAPTIAPRVQPEIKNEFAANNNAASVKNTPKINAPKPPAP